MVSRLLTLVALASFVVVARAQPKPNVAIQNPAKAAEELESIILEADKLDDKLAAVKVKARAAAVLSYADNQRAETMFLQLWTVVIAEVNKDFDKEQAKLVILRQLLPRYPKLGRRLISEAANREKSSEAKTAREEDPQLAAKLGSQLIESDPVIAAGLLEASISNNPGPGGVGALLRLREKNSILSDYVASKVLDALIGRPTLLSLPTLQMMTSYAFPGPEAPISSLEAEASLQSLQYRYFVTGFEVLKLSLLETNEFLVKENHYSSGDLQYRAMNQAQLAAILAALAPRFQPALATELIAINNRLSSQLPPNIIEMMKLPLARLSGNRVASQNAEENFLFALSSGDFDEARSQLDQIGDDQKKQVYAQLLFKNEARSLLAKSDVMGALTSIRKLNDQTTRLVMYLDALKVATKERESELARIVINEARLLIPQTDRNGIHIRALLLFAARLAGDANQVDTAEFVNNAVSSINAPPTTTDRSTPKTLAESAMVELNDPASLLDAPEIETAFSAVGLLDLDLGLIQAKRLKLKSLQLMARLHTVQGVIKRNSMRPKAPAKVSSTPK